LIPDLRVNAGTDAALIFQCSRRLTFDADRRFISQQTQSLRTAACVRRHYQVDAKIAIGAGSFAAMLSAIRLDVAMRYHPDNQDTGNLSRLREIVEATIGCGTPRNMICSSLLMKLDLKVNCGTTD
jgi:hypothetical protein